MGFSPSTTIADSAAPRRETGTALVLALLSFGHYFIDLYSAALSALQPRLAETMGLSLTQAGMLGGMLVFSSSVCQPAYGYLADRFHSRMFTVLAPGVAGVFISALGLAPSFGWLLLLVFLGGAGVASFHPQASAWATKGVDSSRGTWMAIFISAGTMGMACGPTYFSWLPQWLGMERLYWAGVPGVLCSILLWFTLGRGPTVSPTSPEPTLEEMQASRKERFDLAPLRAVWKPLLLLFLCVFIRSIVQVTYTQLLPLYLNKERQWSISKATLTLSLYLAFGALGGFVGGRLTDRIGGRRVIMISMIGSVPFLLGFFAFTGLPSILCLLGGGLVLLFTIPVNVVMAQDLVPGQTGTVSALMMGFAWGTSGLIFVPLTGLLSDLWTMHTVLAALGLFPLLGFVFARMLPETHRA